MTNPTTPTPGWYEDGTGQQRYWDGAQWTEHTAPLVQPAGDVSSTEQQASATGAAPAAPASSAATIQPPPTAAETAQPVSATPAGASMPHVTPRKQRNVLGLVAFIVAVVGFIFACIPGALIIGWILLPIAFILAIVALFFKGQSKALALTGLILSVVGTIVAFVVFFAVVANSFNDAFGGTASSVTQTDAPKASAAAKDDAGAKADAGTSKVGTRDNPAAIGSVIKGNDYTVTINSVNLNATDAILAANQFNEAPADGSVYALINATVTYTGKDSGSAALVGISYVTADGNVIHSYDKLVLAPDPTLGMDEMYNGASATGNVALQIPAAADGLIRVRPGVIADEVFVKTK